MKVGTSVTSSVPILKKTDITILRGFGMDNFTLTQKSNRTRNLQNYRSFVKQAVKLRLKTWATFWVRTTTKLNTIRLVMVMTRIAWSSGQFQWTGPKIRTFCKFVTTCLKIVPQFSGLTSVSQHLAHTCRSLTTLRILILATALLSKPWIWTTLTGCTARLVPLWKATIANSSKRTWTT